MVVNELIKDMKGHTENLFNHVPLGDSEDFFFL